MMSCNSSQVIHAADKCHNLGLKSAELHVVCIEEWILEAKTDCYGKDQLFVASFAFWVITFEPIMI